MPLAASWKTAKTTFETATGKKKPSEKFLGVFRKGTGIESALKDVDGAKNAADLRKALAKFNAAYTEYLKQLDKSAADPKTVPAADKPAYVAAIAKLKADLQKMEADGEAIAKTLGDAGGKEKVDANALKEADEHLKLRLKGQAESAELVKAFKADLGKVDSFIAMAKKQLDAARAAGKRSDTMGHQVAVGVIGKCIGEIDAIAKKVRATYNAKVTDNSSTLMKARMDPSTDKLPKSVLDSYLPKSKEAFRKMSASTAELTTLLNEVENKVDEVEALLALAEGAGSQMKDPKVVVAQLEKVLAEVVKEHKAISIKADRVIKGNEQVAAIAKEPKENQLKWYTLQEGQWARYEPDVKNARTRFGSLRTQATALPPAAREDAKVAKAVADVESAVKDALDYLDTVVLAGGQLLAKIKLQRTKAGG